MPGWADDPRHFSPPPNVDGPLALATTFPRLTALAAVVALVASLLPVTWSTAAADSAPEVNLATAGNDTPKVVIIRDDDRVDTKESDSSLQDAVDTAEEGDTLEITGTVDGGVDDVDTADLTFVGDDDDAAINCADNDDNSDRGVKGELPDATFENLTISECRTGVWLEDDADPADYTFTDVTFQENITGIRTTGDVTLDWVTFAAGFNALGISDDTDDIDIKESTTFDPSLAFLARDRRDSPDTLAAEFEPVLDDGSDSVERAAFIDDVVDEVDTDDVPLGDLVEAVENAPEEDDVDDVNALIVSDVSNAPAYAAEDATIKVHGTHAYPDIWEDAVDSAEELPGNDLDINSDGIFETDGVDTWPRSSASGGALELDEPVNVEAWNGNARVELATEESDEASGSPATVLIKSGDVTIDDVDVHRDRTDSEDAGDLGFGQGVMVRDVGDSPDSPIDLTNMAVDGEFDESSDTPDTTNAGILVNPRDDDNVRIDIESVSVEGFAAGVAASPVDPTQGTTTAASYDVTVDDSEVASYVVDLAMVGPTFSDDDNAGGGAHFTADDVTLEGDVSDTVVDELSELAGLSSDDLSDDVDTRDVFGNIAVIGDVNDTIEDNEAPGDADEPFAVVADVVDSPDTLDVDERADTISEQNFGETSVKELVDTPGNEDGDTREVAFGVFGDGVEDEPDDPEPTPDPDPEPDDDPPEEIDEPDEDVEPIEPDVPEGESAETESGSGQAFVDGEARDAEVSRSEDPEDRASTDAFIDDFRDATGVGDRVSTDEDDDGRPTISGLLSDPDDEDASRPVPSSATTAVTSGDIGALVTTTTREESPRDGGEGNRVFASSDGLTGLVAAGLPEDLDGQVQLRSDARVLGEFETDDSGTLAGDFSVPEDMPLGDHTLLLTAGGTTLSLGIEVDDRRIAGADRFATAASLSQADAPDDETDDVDRVLIAPSHDPAGDEASPDALGAAALSGQVDGPVLLVDSRNGTLDDATSDELVRLDPDTVTVLGGEAVIDTDLFADVDDAGDWTVDRIAGADRYETAADLAGEVAAADDTMIVASGESLVDALSAGALAAAGPHPIVLATSDDLPDASAEALADADEAILVGGDAVLSDQVKQQVADAVGSDPLRLAGADRTATATALADYLIDEVDGFDGDGIVLANGTTLVDALTGARYAGTRGHPIVLANAEDDLAATQAWLADNADTLDLQTTLGGEAVITEALVEDALDAADR